MLTNVEDRKLATLRKLWAANNAANSIPKLETAIEGLDEVLEGGLPVNRPAIVSAGPGAGKTVLLAEFIYRGATSCNEPGIFLTFEERPEDIRHNLAGFGWDIATLEHQKKIAFLNASPTDHDEAVIGQADWLEPIVAQITHLTKAMDAKRLSIDNLGAMLLRYGDQHNPNLLRQKLFSFAARIKELGLTALISSEMRDSEAGLMHYGIQEYVADSLIELTTTSNSNADVRVLRIKKMRGCAYRSGSVIYEISSKGIQVFPKIPVDTKVGETNFDTRVSIGVAAIDKAMGGGIPEGHMMMVAGNTGAGKTTLALHYLWSSLNSGESCVWVALEEPVKQIIKTALAHGWDLSPFIKKGKLRFVTAPLIDMVPDKVLYESIDAVIDCDATRIIVDSVSSIESAVISQEEVRNFLIQLSGFAKKRSLTVLMNYLSGETFGASSGQLLGNLMTNSMRLSSIVDGIILLRYVERDQGVRKLLNILKLRGSHHIKDILQYEIDKKGLQLGNRFGVDPSS